MPMCTRSQSCSKMENKSRLNALPPELLQRIVAYLDIASKAALLSTCRGMSQKRSLFLPFVPYHVLPKLHQEIYGISAFLRLIHQRSRGIPRTARILISGKRLTGSWQSSNGLLLALAFDKPYPSIEVYAVQPRQNPLEYAAPIFVVPGTCSGARFSDIGNTVLLIASTNFTVIVNATSPMERQIFNFNIALSVRSAALHCVETPFVSPNQFYWPTSHGIRLVSYRFQIDPSLSRIFANPVTLQLETATPLGINPQYYYFYKNQLCVVDEYGIVVKGQRVYAFDRGLAKYCDQWNPQTTSQKTLKMFYVCKLRHDDTCLALFHHNFEHSHKGGRMVSLYHFEANSILRTIDYYDNSIVGGLCHYHTSMRFIMYVTRCGVELLDIWKARAIKEKKKVWDETRKRPTSRTNEIVEPIGRGTDQERATQEKEKKESDEKKESENEEEEREDGKEADFCRSKTIRLGYRPEYVTDNALGTHLVTVHDKHHLDIHFIGQKPRMELLSYPTFCMVTSNDPVA